MERRTVQDHTQTGSVGLGPSASSTEPDPGPGQQPRQAPGQAPARARRGRAVATGALSLLVVLAALLYVVLPADPSLDVDVRELSGAMAYDHVVTADYTLASAALPRRARETVYGRVLAPSGIPVTRARLTLTGLGRALRRQGATVRLGGVGTYRSRLRLTPGRYRVTVSLRAAGKARQASRSLVVRDKRSYLVSVTVRDNGIVTMLPISGY